MLHPLRLFLLSVVMTMASFTSAMNAENQAKPIVVPQTVFSEKDGMLAVEAEHFAKQTSTEKRAFYLTTRDNTPTFKMDGDASHVANASGGAYLEILPDTRRNHGEKLIPGENFSNEPGKLAVLHYNVHISTPGRYYVWVRAHSTGSEDNGLHVGIDGQWPESGRRLQWCVGKNTWRWDSMQRTQKVHCGVPHQIYLDIEKPGDHTVHFSMREDGFEFDKWFMTKNRNFVRPSDTGPTNSASSTKLPSFPFVKLEKKKKQAQDKQDRNTSPTKSVSDAPQILPRKPDGNGDVNLTGEQKTWHKLTLTLNGPYAHEQDNAPNPFLDYRMTVVFRHTDGTTYNIPGYFAADGNAAETSAEAGTQWRAHFAPDRTGTWNYSATLVRGTKAAIDPTAPTVKLHQVNGSFGVYESDKTGRDFRSQGRLQYVGGHYLQHIGSKKFFLKAGADAPETLLGYADFDGTVAGKPKRVPLKTYAPHLQDWKDGDPTWQNGKGKGLIGAINYLSGKGCNAFSFLTYNAGGDGDNVWPFIQRMDKLHYDCSKLDQWSIVFDHGTKKGMYLHFKMQETENDDHKLKQTYFVPTCLDGGNLGDQRKLYIRELIARFGHNLALNWNLGEENTQSTQQQLDMIGYIRKMDAYEHHVVLHTYPDQQDKVYRKLLGNNSALSGVSLQNSSIYDTHKHTVKWVEASAQAGHPWVVAFDESGTAAHGQCPDLGYRGFDGTDGDGKNIYDQHAVRRATLWGTLLGGGAGVEYYFGYKFAENDLVCEDWRSRDQSWDYCRLALEFFRDHEIPFQNMKPSDHLVGNVDHDNSKYCFAQQGKLYLVYLPNGGSTELDLSDAPGTYSVSWFNPRSGGELTKTADIKGGSRVTLDSGRNDAEDWLAMIRLSK